MFNATVDKVIKKFSDAVVQLNNIVAQERFEAEYLLDQADVYKDKSLKHTKEAERAEKLVENFNKLLVV